MSRGLGATQRFVLGYLGSIGESPFIDEIAAERAGRQPTRSERESIRRAVHRLADEGLVETSHVRTWNPDDLFGADWSTVSLAVGLPKREGGS